MASQPPSGPRLPLPLLESPRTRNFLGWAFGISLIIHLALGPFFSGFQALKAQNKDVEKVSIEKKTPIKPPTPPPTQPPTPPPPKQTPPPEVKNSPPPAVKLKVNVPKTTAKNVGGPSERQYNVTKGSQEGIPQGTAPTGPPAPAPTQPPATAPPPTPTPKPACNVPNVDPKPITKVEPDYPELARQQGAAGVSNVRVTLDATGRVTNTKIEKSAGNQALDNEAMRAAKATSFSPEIRNCDKVPGDYLFVATFEAQ